MINPDIVFVFQVVNFLALLLLLHVLLYRPIRKVLADRASEVSSAKDKAVSVDLEVQEKMAQYEQRLRSVKADANEDRNRMITEARAEESSIIEAARSEAGDSLADIKQAIEKETAAARTVLHSQADSLSRAICEKVLGRELA